MKAGRLLIIGCLFLFLSGQVYSGSNTTRPGKPGANSVRGEVTDKVTKEKLTGVAITLDGLDKTIYSDDKGTFVVDGLQPGEYKAHFSLISYKEQKVKISVREDESRNLSILLEAVEP